MVRARLSIDAKTKEFQWTMLDEKDSAALYIETPNHNLVVIRNYPVFKKAEDSFAGTLEGLEWRNDMHGETFRGKTFITENPDLIARHPLIRHFQIASCTGNEVVYYHPILEKDIPTRARKLTTLNTLIMISTDVLKFVLEHDEKQRRLALEEHRMLREQSCAEFATVANSVQ